MEDPMSKRRYLAALSLVVVFTLISTLACNLPGLTGTTPGASNTPGGVNLPPAAPGTALTLPGAEPPTLDPALAGDSSSVEYIVELFSGLVTLNDKLEPAPDLAQKWEISPDGKTYTFTLRQGVKFHNGKDLKAGDFKYSLERACNPKTESTVADTYLGDIVGAADVLSGKATAISGVQVVDDYTLKITIDAPKAYFLSKLTAPTAFVVDKANVEAGGKTWTDKLNGTGPFTLKQLKKGELIILGRNDLYYGDKARLQEVRYVLAGGSSMTMYENGELDMTAVGLADIERVTDPKNALSKELQVVDHFDFMYVGFNTQAPPFDDVKVRQAFAYAIDKAKLAEVVYKSTVVATNGILPPGMPGYNKALKGLGYDVAKAKELLAQSKYAGKMAEVTLFVSGSGGTPARSVSALQEMWKQNLGVQVAVQQVDWATYLNDLKRHKFQMFGVTSGWIADYADPQDFLDILFHSKSYENHMGYANPAVDKALELARVEQDTAKRLKMYQDVEETILADAPVIPLHNSRDYWLLKPYVKGVVRAPMILPWLKNVYIEGKTS
jgi:oligopeptide transport system substrate-binding protein